MKTMIAALAAACVASSAAAQAQTMPQPAFEAALNSGGFVMITLAKADNGRDWTGCASAPHLLGALTLENDLPANQEGFNMARDLALASTDHVFAFRKPAALRNIPRHTIGQWDDARSRVKNRSKQELLSSNGLAFDRTPVGAAAAACAIIEKGLMARQQERVIVAEELPMRPRASV